jgi:hypothetical protein
MAEIVASAGPMWRQYEFGSITLKYLSEPRSSFRWSREGASPAIQLHCTIDESSPISIAVTFHWTRPGNDRIATGTLFVR